MKTLIFDFDGTIADSFETLLGVFEDITGRPQKLTAKEIQDLRGKSLREIIRYLKIKHWQLPRLILKAKRMIAIKMTDIETFDGMPEALDQLQRDGHRMFILSTNGSENISKFLKNAELEDYFAKIYGDIGLRSKSSALKKIMKKAKLNPVDCVYIGDEVRDIEAAKKAGVTSVGVAWGFNNSRAIKNAAPDFVAERPKDLVKYLDV